MSGTIYRRGMMDDEAEESSGPHWAKRLDLYLRGTSQVVGLVLILVGAYHALQVFFDVEKVVRNPAELDAAVTKMVQVLDVQKEAIPIGSTKVSIGKPVGVAVLLVLYLLCAWISLAILAVGGKLVFGVINERREFLAAMKEFLVTLRQEGTSSRPTSGA